MNTKMLKREEVAALRAAQDQEAKKFWSYPDEHWQKSFQEQWLLEHGFPASCRDEDGLFWGEEEMMKIRETRKFYVVHYDRYEAWQGNIGYTTTADVYYSKSKWEKAAKSYGYTDPRPNAPARYGMTIAECLVGAVTPSRVRLGA